MTIRDLIEMGADLDTPIYICGHMYDYEGTGDLIAKYENENGVDTAQIAEDGIVLFGDVEEYKYEWD